MRKQLLKTAAMMLALTGWAFGQLFPWDAPEITATGENEQRFSAEAAVTDSFWLPTSLDNVAVNDIVFNAQGHIFVATHGDGIFRSTNNGQSWTNLGSGLSTGGILSLAVDDTGWVYAGTFGDGIFRSTDNGDTWEIASTGILSPFVFTLQKGINGELFAGTLLDGVFRSSNRGGSWELLDLGLPSPATVYDLQIAASGEIFAAVSNVGIFRSGNDGLEWNTTGLGLEGVDIRTLLAKPNGELFAGAWAQGVFILPPNNGIWSQTTLSNIHIMDLVTAPNGDLFAATHGSGVAVSGDNGITWELPVGGLFSAGVWSLAISPDGYLYAGTSGNGIFRTFIPLPPTAIDTPENEPLPNQFTLQQNYPNPFNPTTTIPFQLSQSANVTLRIVDLTGRTVAELLNGRKPAGSHEIEFFAGNIGSGIYFYVLTVDGVRESRRMILLK
ncbi:MAG: T9SS type A sorting domain-containing protein [Calditrichaeota bacterium]|nr:T9SS type A sorting domain-containing protein [Calditrichota bacterium]MCB0269166.1 T9SS type A sorting domain-containing protein [Calditrichota bacterium]